MCHLLVLSSPSRLHLSQVRLLVNVCTQDYTPRSSLNTELVIRKSTVFWIIRLILVWMCVWYLSGAEIFHQTDGCYFICVVSLKRGNL